MNQKLLKLFLCLLLLAPILSGCWDRLEIEERAAILGLAIDPVTKQIKDPITGKFAKSNARGYKITAQVAIPGRIPLGPGGPSGGGGGQQKPIWILSTTGKTIDDAVNSLQQELANRVFFGQLRVIIVNEALARSTGMHDIQDFFRRNAEIRRLAWLIISKNKAKQAMETAPQLERVPTLYLVGMMDHAVQMGKIPNIFLGNYWSALSSDGRDPVLPYISIQSSDKVSIEGLAVFKGDRMVSSLDPFGVAAYMEMTNQHHAGYGIAVPMPGDPTRSVIVKGTSRRSKIKVSMKNGKPAFDIYMRIEANIEEMNGSKRISSEVIQQISNTTTQLLLKNQKNTINKLKDLQTDVIGFGEYVRGEYPEEWVKYRSRDKWDKEFVKIDVQLHMNIYMRRMGMSSR